MIFLISLFIHFIVSGAHSFSRKILLNFTGQFTKFRGSPCQNCPNSVAYRGLLFVRKLSFILLKKLLFLDAGMALLATCKENY